MALEKAKDSSFKGDERYQQAKKFLPKVISCMPFHGEFIVNDIVRHCNLLNAEEKKIANEVSDEIKELLIEQGQCEYSRKLESVYHIKTKKKILSEVEILDLIFERMRNTNTPHHVYLLNQHLKLGLSDNELIYYNSLLKKSTLITWRDNQNSRYYQILELSDDGILALNEYGLYSKYKQAKEIEEQKRTKENRISVGTNYGVINQNSSFNESPILINTEPKIIPTNTQTLKTQKSFWSKTWKSMKEIFKSVWENIIAKWVLWLLIAGTTAFIFYKYGINLPPK